MAHIEEVDAYRRAGPDWERKSARENFWKSAHAYPPPPLLNWYSFSAYSIYISINCSVKYTLQNYKKDIISVGI